MVQLVLISHGKMAEGVENSLEMLMGEQKNIHSLAFIEDMSKNEFKKILQNKINSFRKEPTLIIGDLIGGTPCNCALELFIDNKEIEIIAPLSLPLVLSASMMENEEFSVKDLLSEGIESHKDLKKMMNELLMEDD